MKRIIKVLVVSALMVVLMAITVSPAFAAPKDEGPPEGEGRGYGPTPEKKWCGNEEKCDAVFGSAHGSKEKTGYYGY